MGLFNKKPDPISQRAQALSAEIAALEAQIKRLSAPDKKLNGQESQPIAPPAAPASTPAPPAASQPRLRSTALPHHRQHPPGPAPIPTSTRGPVFEEVDRNRIQSPVEAAPPGNTNTLDVRKYDLGAFWRRLKTHFRGPPTSNPKLVNYLAAGSIQGLRPLRYERRVARNRFLVLVVCLVLVLWGLIAIFVRHK